MTKTELIATVAESASISKKDAGAAVSAVFGAISEELVKGEKVSDIKTLYTKADFEDGVFVVKKGKKVTKINLCSIGLPKEEFNLLIIPVNIDQKLK